MFPKVSSVLRNYTFARTSPQLEWFCPNQLSHSHCAVRWVVLTNLSILMFHLSQKRRPIVSGGAQRRVRLFVMRAASKAQKHNGRRDACQSCLKVSEEQSAQSNTERKGAFQTKLNAGK